MGKVKVDDSISLGKVLDKQLEKFIPRFGNANDIEISRLCGEIRKLMTIESRQSERAKELKDIIKSRSARVKRIENMEKRALWLIAHRD